MVSCARGADMRVAMDQIGKKYIGRLTFNFFYKTRVVHPQIVFPQPLILKPYNRKSGTLLDFFNYYTRYQSDITSRCSASLSTSLFLYHLFLPLSPPIAPFVIPTITRFNPVKPKVKSPKLAHRWIQLQFTACARPNRMKQT